MISRQNTCQASIHFMFVKLYGRVMRPAEIHHNQYTDLKIVYKRVYAVDLGDQVHL